MSASTNRSTTAKGEPSAVESIANLIAEQPFLAGLQPTHLQLLADNAMRMQYEPGEYIFREGDPANRFYLIERGAVSLESPKQEGPPVPVQTIGVHDVLGWSWLFPPYYWQFDARAAEPTTAIFFYGTRLREQCEQDHDFGFEIMKRVTQVVIHRLQAARKQLLALRT